MIIKLKVNKPGSKEDKYQQSRCERCDDKKATVVNDIGENLCRVCLKDYIKWGEEIEEEKKRFNIK